MGIDVKIFLNQHAKAEHVFEVIQKIVGHDFNYKTFDSKKNIKYNFNEPTSKENPWYYKPLKSDYNHIEIKNTDYFVFHFKDCVGSHYQSLFHFDIEDDDFDNGKLMGPRSCANWGAIGKRLVDFFGGKMMYADCQDPDDVKNWHIGKNPKYPPRKKGQDSDDRWYQYYNVLAKEPILTKDEILNMKDFCAAWVDRDEKLVEYLTKYEQAIELSNNLKDKPQTKRKSTKLKV